MGVAYHLLFFSRINRAAFFFGGFFILQAAILFYTGLLKNELSFRFRFDTSGVIGMLLILYALVVYPLVGFVFGHVYLQLPTFAAKSFLAFSPRGKRESSILNRVILEPLRMSNRTEPNGCHRRQLIEGCSDCFRNRHQSIHHSYGG